MQKILVGVLPLAKSSDLRLGITLRTKDLYSGWFSIGFLNKK